MPFAQNFWHASSCSGKETFEVWAVLGGPSSRHAVTLCSWSPQALVQPWWRARRDASSLCPPAPCPDPAPGDHGPPQGAVAGSGAWGKPGPYQIPTSLLSDSAADRLTGLHWETQFLTQSVKKNQSLWMNALPARCCSESVVLHPVKLLQEASPRDEASLPFVKGEQHLLLWLSTCEPGASPLGCPPCLPSFSRAGGVPFTMTQCTPLSFDS